MNGFERVVTRLCPVQVERNTTVSRTIFRVPASSALAAIIIFFALQIQAQTPPAWRYDLRRGDHLTYRYTFQRRTESKEEQSQVEVRFRTHVLVAGENADRLSVGFQRNREAAELTEFRSNGKDKLARERVDFEKRLRKRPSHFSEAMETSLIGEPRYPWEFARETYSHLIDTLHEVMSLPPTPPPKGASWPNRSIQGFDFRWIDDETIHGKLCHRVEGAFPNGSLKLSYWWSPESGVLEQIAFEGSYDSGTVRETARMELESKARGESMESWLASPEMRLGVLQVLVLTPTLPISAEQLTPALTSDDPTAQSLALAAASARKIEISSATLTKLGRSPSALIQAQLKLNSGNPSFLANECHHPLPLKSPPERFATIFDVVPPAANSPTDKGQSAYLLRIPLSYRAERPSPLLVYLSGGAGYAIDGAATAEDVVSQTDYLVLYPQAPASWWTPAAARSFDAIFQDVLHRYNVDPDRIYLTGFSNGGTGALYFAALWPQRFAAVVSLMGAGQCNEQVKAGLPNVKNLPLLFVHGENDPLITPDCSRVTHQAFTDLHPAVPPQLKILSGHAHDITLQNDEGLTLAFFKDKVRNPFPRTVDLSEFDAIAVRAYWIEILDGAPGKSDLDARLKSDNTIEIHSHEVKKIRLHLRPELLPEPGDYRVAWNGKKMFSGPLRDYCSSSDAAGPDPKLDLSDIRDLELPGKM
jgi:pimeloyl-ACP methyl ester carboxylesterase